MRQIDRPDTRPHEGGEAGKGTGDARGSAPCRPVPGVDKATHWLVAAHDLHRTAA